MDLKIRAYGNDGKPLTVNAADVTEVVAVGGDNCEVIANGATYKVMTPASEVLALTAAATPATPAT